MSVLPLPSRDRADLRALEFASTRLTTSVERRLAAARLDPGPGGATPVNRAALPAGGGGS